MAQAGSKGRAGIDHRSSGAVNLRSAVAANLLAFERVSSDRPQAAAAVAIVVLENGGLPCVPIFQRTSDMSRHAGQMALPGGRLHEGETVEECARRELGEELGLDSGPADVAGLLDDFDTRSGFTITPVVLFASARLTELRPSKFEVARLFPVPLQELRAAASRAEPGSSRGFSLKLEQVEVFAPTAAILYQFSEVALDGRPVRVADFYQPPFTHR
jgi:8-oxo-dGTP pyrophosphatase MutT (NUDIX family)